MKIKILRDVLVGAASVTPTPSGAIVEMEDNEAKEYIAAGLAEAWNDAEAKAVPAAPKNKMAPAAVNKTK